MSSLALRILARAAVIRSLGGPGSGNFGHEGRPGEVGGSGEGGGSGQGSKPKSPAATKAQIDQAYQMYKAGSSHKDTAKALGLNHKQVATIVFKVNKQQAALKEKISLANPAASGYGKIPGVQEPKPVAGVPHDLPSDAVPGAHVLTAAYDWKEKTSGPQAGKWAYFEKGTNVQVSAAFPKGEHEKAIPTLHYGKGPMSPLELADSKKAAAEKVAYEKAGGDKAAAEQMAAQHEVEKGAAPAPTGWPIGNDVMRTAGENYPTKVAAAASPWAKGLSEDEKTAIRSYTGSAYSTINSYLREGGKPALGGSPLKVATVAAHLQSALAKAPAPPPPELVWRGVSSSKVNGLVSTLATGDVITMKGFQSTSIDPKFANSWGHGNVLFEIKPKAGAYVNSISSHKTEKEFILPHGAKYAVRGVATVKIGGSSHNIVQLEQLDHGHQ